MPTVHLICGPTGAGKTTYAIALAERARAVRFSIDEWMATLFVADRPEPPAVAWATERIQRCERQIWAIAQQLIARNVDVVLDLGFARSDHRDRVRALVAQTRAESKLHYLDVSPATRRARVLENARDEVIHDRGHTRFAAQPDEEGRLAGHLVRAAAGGFTAR